MISGIGKPTGIKPPRMRASQALNAKDSAYATAVLSFAVMSDPRLPLKIRPVPGGFAFAFAGGGRHIYVYGREPHVAQAAGSLTIDEATALAQEIARAPTAAWTTARTELI